LIHRGHPAASILAITFTNKAADEMRRRVEEMVGEGRVFISTFHSMCARFLRASGACLGINPSFTICDADDQKSLVKQILKDLNLDPSHYPPASVLSSISLMKNRMIGPAEASEQAASFFERAVSRVYESYDELLRVNESLDFDDLLCKTLEMFQQHADVLGRYRERFRFTLIDEYQDTNRVQYLLARSLAGGSGNLCATGDPDQSIYRWRGADVHNIMDFESDFPGARVIKLEQNYRSSGNIIKAASEVISNNVMRKERDLWTEAPDGDRLKVLRSESETEEADRIVQIIRDLRGEGIPCRQIAVFYRINALSRGIERSLRLYNIPYVIVGGVEFYQRKEVKDLLAYLRVIHNPRDSVSLYRILNTPPRGIGLTTLKRVKKDALEQRRPPVEILRDYTDESGLAARSLKSLKSFLGLLDGWQKIAAGGVEELLKTVIDDVRFLEYLKNFNDGSSAERLENVSELIYAVGEYERYNPEPTLGGFLEETALIQDIDSWNDGSDSVTLMTLHSAKGLEFDAVFIIGVEEGLIPHSRSMDDDEEFEEERRLMYVGLTRARKKLFLSHSLFRSRFGERVHSLPSRFIDEIPDDVLELPPRAAEGVVFSGGWPAGGEETEPVLEYDGEEIPVFDRGDRVEHPYFGRGEVVQVSGSGLSARLKVFFPRAGEKLLLLEHAQLKKIL
jgi:DNA helicase-2/ATP-dependent DNA helicase PcrA